MKIPAFASMLLLLSGVTSAAETCPIAVQVQPYGIEIDGSACKSDLRTFWQSVQSHLPKSISSQVRWLSVIGPVGPDHLTALGQAWGSACQRKTGAAATFLQSYRTLSASHVLAPALAPYHPVVSGIDNFYPLHPSQGPAIRSPGCNLELLPPVIYYRLQAPNNSFKPNPLRGSA